jgi:thiamine-phosphate pyrophosphorylase
MDLPIKQRIAQNIKGLYVIVDVQFAKGKDIVELTQSVLKGGAQVIQLRDKLHDKGDVLPVARRIRDLCEQHGAIFIINDHADLAVACDAHGLHLGQHDLPIKEARAILRPHQIIGKSNAFLDEALDSEGQGADYLAIGTIFPTNTKENARPAGLQTLEHVKPMVSVPIVAIGGINKHNVTQVMQAGADSVCVISAVIGDPNPEEAARRLIDAMGGSPLTKSS